jgi:hypothetical protein
MYKLIALICLMTTLAAAQIHGTKDSLSLSNQNPDFNLPQSTASKPKHREFVVSWFKPYLISASNTQDWGYPYEVDGETEDIYYTYQSKVKYTPIFKGGRGLTIAITYKKQKWLPNLYVKYGFGFHSFDFSFTRQRDTLETMLLKKTTILVPEEYNAGKTEVVQYASEAFVDRTFTSIFYTFPSISHAVVSFYMPFALEYKLKDKTAIGIDVNVLFPMSAKASGYYYNIFLKENRSILIETSLIRRGLINVGLHVQHNFYKKYFLEAYSNFGEIFDPRAQKMESRYKGLDYSYVFNFGLKAGMYY